MIPIYPRVCRGLHRKPFAEHKVGLHKERFAMRHVKQKLAAFYVFLVIIHDEKRSIKKPGQALYIHNTVIENTIQTSRSRVQSTIT